MSMIVDADNAAKEFKREGDITDNSLFKFMAYWIAFCIVYSADVYSRSDEETGFDAEDEIPNEWEKISKYCKGLGSKLDRIDLCQYRESMKLFAKPVFSTSSHNNKGRAIERAKIIEKALSDSMCVDKTKMAIAVYQTIYQVRCNLFHGSKELEGPRTSELLNASNMFLEGTLNVLL